jgi:hypothetical protein
LNVQYGEGSPINYEGKETNLGNKLLYKAKVGSATDNEIIITLPRNIDSATVNFAFTDPFGKRLNELYLFRKK